MRFEPTIVTFGSRVEKNSAGRPSRALGGAGGPCLLKIKQFQILKNKKKLSVFLN